MIMGIIILHKRYELSKYLSVLMITIGIIVCTIVSGSNVVSKIHHVFFIISTLKENLGHLSYNFNTKKTGWLFIIIFLEQLTNNHNIIFYLKIYFISFLNNNGIFCISFIGFSKLLGRTIGCCDITFNILFETTK